MIVENIVSFASRIGAQTIAEYVDTKAVHEKVCELGIDFSQGYYIGEPQAEVLSNTISDSVNNIA
jgi:EAL domain-containing protein (putative c-di-GMP-specific phosphodiesterase class I)